MIVCIGESLIDVVDGENHVGGCPLNVALTASRLGASVALFSKISQDSMGRLILETLIDNCIMFDPPMCSSHLPTMKGHAVVDENGCASYKFDWEGSATVSFTHKELENAFSVMTDIDFVMTGSLGTVLPPGCDEIFPAISTIEPKPVVFYDPNVRPAVIACMEDFERKMLEYTAKSDIVKVSDDDLALVYGSKDAYAALNGFKVFCKDNNVHLIVTKGSKGSTWFAPSFTVDVPAAEAKDVVDTIGCGDTFDGAILMQLQKMKDEMNLPSSTPARAVLDSLGHEDVRRLLGFASKASALNCREKGCNPPRLVDVMACQTT